MGVLTVKDMRERVDRREELFDVPEFGDGAQLKLRSISMAQRDILLKEGSLNGKVDGGTDPLKMARLLLLHGIEEPKLTPEDVDAIYANMAAATIDKVVRRIMEFNGFIKEAEKNSEISFRTPA